MSNIEPALRKLFDHHRIVFWYDANLDLRQEFDQLWLQGIEKLEINRNEFWLKQHILREKPNQKFLLYHSGPQPSDEQNWLLDVWLANTELRADKVSMWLGELELLPKDWEFVQSYESFFENKKHREQFHILNQKATASKQKKEDVLLSICLQSNTVLSLEYILLYLMNDLLEEDQPMFTEINRYGLDEYLWKQVGRQYGYEPQQPSVKDFAICLFDDAFKKEINHPSNLDQDILHFIQLWKELSGYQASFEALSEECCRVLGIKAALKGLKIQDLLNIDLFEAVDQYILGELATQIHNRLISGGDTARIVWQRRKTHWFKKYEDTYETLRYTAQFFSILAQNGFSISDMSTGFANYAKYSFEIDQLYRKVNYHASRSQSASQLGELLGQVENQYTNRFLLEINNQWQRELDAHPTWYGTQNNMQVDFYEDQVADYIKNEKRVVVIISDAFRYEAAKEFSKRMDAEKGFESSIHAMLGVIPSYTQLGMAALLPHETLEIREDGAVFVDGLPSAGVDNRAKILQKWHQNAATAIRAEDLDNMNRDALRDLIRQYPLMYVYHNQIDAIGDKRESERQVFNAVEDTIEYLNKLIKRLSNANVSHYLVTADHGFIYQDQEIDEGDFVSEDIPSQDTSYKNRRFVLGHQIQETRSVSKYTTAQLGVTGDVDVYIPKSINRFRRQGAGSRFVHGGCALQEITIPCVYVHKVEGKESPLVDVEILQGNTKTITSGQTSITFYQKDRAVGGKVPRILRAGIYTKEGILISNQEELEFTLESENVSEREVKVRFILNQNADISREQEVEIRLEQLVQGTNHFELYKSATLKLAIRIQLDF